LNHDVFNFAGLNDKMMVRGMKISGKKTDTVRHRKEIGKFETEKYL
jgi:hypothetical protein